MTILKPNLNQIYSPIEGELAQFKASYRHELESGDELMGSINTHLLKMGGKFLRPALTLLCAKLKSEPASAERAIKLAVAVEMIHTATLVHDDIIDESDFRRNQPSVYSKWGREISIVAGDYLYAKAFMILAGLRDVWLSEAFAICAHVMCEGEMKQIEKRNDFLMSEAVYEKIIHKKTAALFQASCMGGAYFAGLNQESIAKIGDYGFRLGMAFQIVDDCLDMTALSKDLGKPAGLDLLKNDITLPVIYVFAALPAKERQELTTLIGSNPVKAAEQIKIIALEKDCVNKAMQKARNYIDEALANLSCLNESDCKDSLISLAAHCLDRGN